ncbi:hypothetical protein N7444_007531 [Penicillium canescens]|nr:hypothetical protein N7444_007531 [Penicillium canescens]
MPNDPSLEHRWRNQSVTQVRCDRRDPCGNCQDAGVSCCRQRETKRRSKITRPQEYRIINSPHSPRLQITPEYEIDAKLADINDYSLAELMPEHFIPSHDLGDSYEPWAIMSYDPAYDAQVTVQHQLQHLQGLTGDRRRVLESALSVIGVLSDDSRGLVEGKQFNEQLGELPRVPLYRIAHLDVESERFGSFIADYFRHISKPTLKGMCLSLLHNKASPCESMIYTVCVNATAYRFLITIINLEDDPELVLGLKQSATEYRLAAQAALKQIPLPTTPSIALLQAFICGAFLYQACGDVGLSGNLIKSACKICIDLDLHNAVLHGNATEEEIFCFIRCYTLNRNYAFKSQKSWCPFDAQLPSNLCDLYPIHPPISEFLLIHLDLAHVQDTLLSCYLSGSLTKKGVLPLHHTGNYLLRKMQYIQGRMNQAEISTLKFAYQSVMTAILYLLQTDKPQVISTTENYLQSARRELSTLVSMCQSAEEQSAVNLLNRTVLLYPATAYLVLFCNVIATSDIGDFSLMKAMVDCLARSGISYPLVQLRTLFQRILNISEAFFIEEGSPVQRTPLEPQSYSSLSYPVGNPFSISWNTDEMLLTSQY